MTRQPIPLADLSAADLARQLVPPERACVDADVGRAIVHDYYTDLHGEAWVGWRSVYEWADDNDVARADVYEYEISEDVTPMEALRILKGEAGDGTEEHAG